MYGIFSPAQPIVEHEDRDSQRQRTDDGIDKQGEEHIHTHMNMKKIPYLEPDEKQSHDENTLFVVHLDPFE